MKSIELFAGVGGLALGLKRAGFHHEAVIERDKYAAESLRSNHSILGLKSKVPVKELDSRDIDFHHYEGKIDLLSGGPPCQPFSMGGKHFGSLDDRDMFPEVFRAMHEIRPKAVVMENVKGLARPQFSDYVDYLKLRMSMPELMPNSAETRSEHRDRLSSERTQAQFALKYKVQFIPLNAANFGVPQKRERVFFVALREDIGADWSPPEETHCSDRLLWDKWVTGEYWERLQVPKSKRVEPDQRIHSRLRFQLESEELPAKKAWKTVREAISVLPVLEECETDPQDANHQLNPGARSYPGHTGSILDEPSKTIKAGDHGVPGGENTLQKLDGTVRYFSVRECACLQTFPVDFYVSGPWSQQMRQIGNAVPVLLAEAVGRTVATALSVHDTNNPESQISGREAWSPRQAGENYPLRLVY